MSIFQSWIEQDRAVVAVDTLAYAATGELVESNKMVILAQSNSVMACRGSQLAFFQVLAQVWLVPGLTSYDNLAEKLPELISWAAANFPAGFPDEATQCEVHLVGWSEAKQSMAGVTYVADLNAKTAKLFGEVNRCRVAPLPKVPIPACFDDQRALQLARDQVAWMEGNTPTAVTGGRLLVAEITRAGTNVRDLGAING
ncbi:hypothetical protein [Thermomonas carbonis]|uniref:Uncharacterized protein n=1 Tax=Thermomonas carbonis TaxID=1463158 RepID=A0A7G9SPS9_9GAMM|nr:hypothetical protein [Thermomonas carbonis]QNN69854.1 hypothetical protein H9L16_14600 [Thermomonas carbonis]GHB95911.1 hypothetical protein GCM10010080_04550 [Thermomonas carbonis]